MFYKYNNSYFDIYKPLDIYSIDFLKLPPYK